MKSNSISNNARKLKKYSKRLAKSHDVEKNKVYNQKIRFYQQNMKGGGVEPDANTNVDALISKIDSLIQQSNAIKQSGGSIQKLQGSRIMSNMRNQRGGVGEEDELQKLINEANDIKDIEANVSGQQKKTVDVINTKILDISRAYGADKEVIMKLEGHIEQLKAKIEQLLKEKEGISGKNADNDKVIQILDEQIEKLKQKLNELEEANKKLQEEKDALQKEKENSEDLKNKNEEKDKTIENLKNEMDEAVRAAEVKQNELKERIKQLEGELNELKQKCGANNEQISGLNEELEKYKNLLNQATEALRKLITQNKTLQGQNKTLGDDLETIKNGILEISSLPHSPVEELESRYKPEEEPKKGGNRMRSLDELLTYSVQIPADF